jgi:hypothetical protein
MPGASIVQAALDRGALGLHLGVQLPQGGHEGGKAASASSSGGAASTSSASCVARSCVKAAAKASSKPAVPDAAHRSAAGHLLGRFRRSGSLSGFAGGAASRQMPLYFPGVGASAAASEVASCGGGSTHVGGAPLALARLERLLRLAGQVAAAAAHLHAHGVVHADICPANVLLCGRTSLGGAAAAPPSHAQSAAATARRSNSTRLLEGAWGVVAKVWTVLRAVS